MLCGIGIELVAGRCVLHRDLRKIRIELLSQDHRYRRIGPLAHRDLGHDQRRRSGTIDADESIRRELAGRIVRRLHRFVDRRTGKWKASKNPPANPPVSNERRETPLENPCLIMALILR
jgi:hypothetical protein